MTSEILDHLRLQINKKLNPDNKSKLGQFMTPSVIADYMASLFDKQMNNIKLLDCGAGIGLLTIAAIKKLKNIDFVDLWEVDPIMIEQLKINMQKMDVNFSVHAQDFIFGAFHALYNSSGARYTHAIINPPYKKINSKSEHFQILKKLNITTANLYSAFLSLAIMLMEPYGQIVAIIPRSFCNGLYYKSFRKFILENCSIEHIHVFNSRNQVFRDDNVLQENVIIKLMKNKRQGKVVISQSNDHKFYDYQNKEFPFSDIILKNDPEQFIHIPFNKQIVNDRIFSVRLSQMGLNVSTGPVVDFRAKEFLQYEPTEKSVPLLYPHNFVNNRLEYPKKHKKPNAIKLSCKSQKWLMPTDGFYVLVKRFSTKEEQKRIVAYIVNPKEIEGKWIGFENHWNVFHKNKHGLDKEVSLGLACFLNSTVFDSYFRIFSGHTQVNATDLKNVQYPSIEILCKLGRNYKRDMNQEQIDQLIENIK